MAEHLLPKQRVASSSLVSRSKGKCSVQPFPGLYPILGGQSVWLARVQVMTLISKNWLSIFDYGYSIQFQRAERNNQIIMSFGSYCPSGEIFVGADGNMNIILRTFV